MLKILVDGVISALHLHDGTQLNVVVERLAARLCVPAREIAGPLTSNPVAVLGKRRLLWPFRDFVQWNPGDDAIVRLSVATKASATWQLSATLTDLARASEPLA